MTNPSAEKYWLGIDVGGTKMLAGVYDAQWKLVGSKKRKTKADEGQAKGLDRLIRTGIDAMNAAGLTPDQLGGVGIGCPGPLDLQTGTLVSAANLGWKDVELKKLLEKTFGVPAAVANDVDAGVFGEATQGAGKGARSVLGVFPGTGIGGGLVYEGKVFRGRNQSCLEVGHMTAIVEGPRCGCGRRGCLEGVAGRLAISAAAASAVLRGQAPWLKENAGSDPAKIRSKTLADAIENGDMVIRDIVEQACDYLGRALGDLVNLLAPEVIVLGGGMIEAMPTVMMPRIRQAMRPRVMDAFTDSYKLKEAVLGDLAVSLGAAALAKDGAEAGAKDGAKDQVKKPEKDSSKK
ncbi:MAG: ROK family protein [Verrucomicrobia bacterium]|nr:ROK family protein [Verrucomicrobiota bacterium]